MLPLVLTARWSERLISRSHLGNLLKIGRKVENKNKKIIQYQFKYENLLDLCYTCRMFGHGEKDCKIKLDRVGTPSSAPIRELNWRMRRHIVG